MNDLLKNIDKARLPGNEQEVFQLLGMTPRDPVSERVREVARAEIQTARALIEPRGLWRSGSLQVHAGNDGTIWFDSLVIQSLDVQRHLSGFDRGVLLVVTIGSALEEAVEELFSAREYARAAMLDAAGSQFAEEAADLLTTLFRQDQCLEETCLTRRFSPGYGDWDVRVQKEILSLTEADALGISCNEASILTPRKSITAIAGYHPGC